MMEEVNDDTNGESTFEIINDHKIDDPSQREPVSSSTYFHSLSAIPLPPTASVSSTSPVSPSLNQLFQSSAPGTFLPSVSPCTNMNTPQLPESPVTVTTTTIPSVPMYNPTEPIGISSSFVTPPSPAMAPQMYGLMSPIPTQSTPFAPTNQGFATSPTALKGSYSSPVTSMPQGASLELPLDDNYVSSSNQSYQGGHSEGGGVWGWIKGNEFLNKVAEKAKNSVDSVITTLDPGMKEIIYSGGDVSLVVASENETKVSAIREAFQQIFGKATVDGIAAQSTSIAPQPVGFSAGVKAAEERISNLRQQGVISEQQAIVAIENFVVELTPDKWFDIGFLMLQDPYQGITLQVYTQAIPVASHFVIQAKEQTPPDYPLGWSGFSVTIGQIIGSAMGVHHSNWHQALTGVSRRDMLFLAAKTLAGLYKSQLKQ